MTDHIGQRVFYIDLARCTGCDTCVIACKDRAALADELDWIRVERQESGLFPRVRLSFRVVHCFHCDRPACLEACPVSAIAHDPGGWVLIDAARCTGCGACVAACPFDAVTLGPDGLATKCDGCADQVAAGLEPTCVRACPMRALFFDDPDTVCRPRVADPGWNDHGIGPRVRYGIRPGL